MVNQEGFDRDLAILEEWKDRMSEAEYEEKLKELYSDYNITESI